MASENSQTSGHNIDYEVRFAVVMYGGVSLAIYINGVAQELLKMVRATSGKRALGDLSSTESVYQKLGCIFSDKGLLRKLEKKSAEEVKQILDKNLNLPDCSPTKFVVDIISGTSAGGINGIFLAKALAEDLDIGELKELWLNEGDIAKLINDKKSVRDIDLDYPKETKSLLNSQRMFLKLLEALEGMDETRSLTALPNGNKKPLVNEIDLFITVTDFEGVSVPIRLLDRVVYERRYKHVFKFRLKNGQSDFEKDHNPILAFAARCTSAFPFAFEPMRISEAEKIIDEAFSDADRKILNLKKDEQRFFPIIKDKDGRTVSWTNRDLVDGGYLDNKPFSYAIDALSQRRADIQVERKLIYVEPSPENLEREKNLTNKIPVPPDAIQNAKAAVSELPRYETIREDLQRILERNRLIERINRLVSGSEKDIFTYLATLEAGREEKPDSIQIKLNVDSEKTKKPKTPGEAWASRDLEDIVKDKGHAVVPYYRLRISSLTDEIAKLVSLKFGIDEDSEYFLAVRTLVNIWRKEKYLNYKKDAPKFEKTETTKNEKIKTVLSFLRTFDLDYRLRRFRFVQQKANQLFLFDNEFQKIFKLRNEKLAEIRNKNIKAEIPPATEEIDQTQETGEGRQLQIQQSLQRFIEPVIETPKTLKTENQLTPTEIIWKMFAGKEEKAADLNEKETSGNSANETTENTEREHEISENKEADLIQLRLVVNYFQTELKRIFNDFLNSKETVYSKTDSSMNLTSIGLRSLRDLSDYAENLQKEGQSLSFLLKSNNPEVYDQINQIAQELETSFNKITQDSRIEIESLLKKNRTELPEELNRENIEEILETKFKNLDVKDRENLIDIDLFNAVRAYLFHFYYNFDDFDQIGFPAFYETKVGEAVKVDVLRISPLDAKFLIDEENKNELRRKLAGTTLFNFGAFLDRVWRKNDIMWGRLDGAERLITAILPGEKYEGVREYLANEMNEIILEEELREADKEDLRGLLAQSLINASSGIELNEVVKKITKTTTDEAVKKRLSTVLRTLLNENLDKESEEKSENLIVKFVRENYEVERNPEPKSILRTISRATQVTGNVFEGVADKHGQSGDQLRWVSRLGLIFWGLVEVAAPNSIWNKIFYHWLKLIYAFEVLLILAATIFNSPNVQQLGIFCLVLTVIANITILTLNDYMRGGSFWTLLRFIAIGLFAILCLTGGIVLFSIFYNLEWLKEIVKFQETFTKFTIWQKLFPVTILILLFVFAYVRREFKKANIRFIGIATLVYFGLTLIIIGVFGWLSQNAGETLCFDQGSRCLGGILSLEFAHNIGEVQKIAGEIGSAARTGLKRALILDSVIFVPLYTGFLVLFANLISFRRNKLRLSKMDWYQNLKKYLERKRAEQNLEVKRRILMNKPENESVLSNLKWWFKLNPGEWVLETFSNLTIWGFITKITLAIILFAGLADLVENFYSYTLLNLPLNENLEWMVGAIHLSAKIKFGLIALTTLIFSTIFWRESVFWKVISIILVLISGVGFWGLIYHPVIFFFMGLQIFMLAIIGFALVISPNKFKK